MASALMFGAVHAYAGHSRTALWSFGNDARSVDLAELVDLHLAGHVHPDGAGDAMQPRAPIWLATSIAGKQAELRDSGCSAGSYPQFAPRPDRTGAADLAGT